MRRIKPIFTFCMSLFLVWGLLLFQPTAKPVAASAGQGVIAYVVPNDTTGDEIHLINPDRTQDREIWRTGTSGLTTGPDVAELTWKPNSSELAFWSRFQEACSFYNGDIYAIRSDGTGFRRVTAPPTCGVNPGLPTGTVQLQVVNNTGTGTTFIVYIEGAPGPKSVTLSDYGSAMVTFNNVVDYGAGVAQWAVAIYGVYRYTFIKAHADVLPGKTVQADGPLYLDYADAHWGWHSPTYNSDGSRLAYFFGTGTIYNAPSDHTTPGGIGSYLLANGVSMPLGASGLQWGRGSHANQLLYQGYDWDSGNAIFLVDEGSTTPGTEEVLIDPYQEGLMAMGLTWLPDDSGFLYSATEKDPQTLDMFGNIFEFRFATQQSTRLTDFTSGFPRGLTISPDGSKVVFEYQASGDWTDLNPSIDLWMMNRDGSQQTLFVQNGQSPAWSPSALPVYRYVYLPLLRK